MRKRSKKFLSLCLALVMALGLVPTAALAADITVTEIVPPKYDQIKAGSSEGLLQVQMNGKWGFIDMSGKEVIPCQYNSTSGFCNGFAEVRLNGKSFYIDRTGKEVTPPPFSMICNFSNGVAIAEQDGGYVLIDTTRQVLTTRIYDWIEDFSEGLAAVRAGSYYYGKWGFIDATGKEVISCAYKKVSAFSGGLAVAQTNSGYSIIDTIGQEVALLPYDYAREISEGLVIVAEETKEKQPMMALPVIVKKYGVSDITGKEIAPCIYDNISSFKDGIAKVEKDGKYGLIDATGKEILPCENHLVNNFSEGLAAVHKETESGYKSGYIDKNGNVVIPFQYGFATDFSDGLAVVHITSDKRYSSGDPVIYCGVIDKTGKEIVSPNKYTQISEFSEGFAAVQDGKTGKWGFIDTTGKEMVPCKYNYTSAFSNGLAMVGMGHLPYYQTGYIDKTGKEVLPCVYHLGSFSLSDGIATFYDEDNNKWGILALTVTGKAQENKQTISIDGKDIPFAMYSPDNGGTNYVRLVDLAVALKGTAGQFNVGYDGKVLLTTGVAYTGAASTAPFHSAMAYTMLDEPTYVNGVAKNLEGIRFEYQNGGYTYYKLRDLGQALGFNVGWDNANQRIYIESGKPYDPNN